MKKAAFLMNTWCVISIPFCLYYLAPSLDNISDFFELENTLIGIYYALSFYLFFVWIVCLADIKKTFIEAFPSLFYATGGYIKGPFSSEHVINCRSQHIEIDLPENIMIFIEKEDKL